MTDNQGFELVTKKKNKGQKKDKSEVPGSPIPGSGKEKERHLRYMYNFKMRLCPKPANHSPSCDLAHPPWDAMRRHPGTHSGEMCIYFNENSQKCPLGDKCKKAHNNNEYTYHPDNYKTEMCYKFLQGHCKYGDKCGRAHGEIDQRIVTKVKPEAVVPSQNDMSTPAATAGPYNSPPQQSSPRSGSGTTSPLSNSRLEALMSMDEGSACNHHGNNDLVDNVKFKSKSEPTIALVPDTTERAQLVELNEHEATMLLLRASFIRTDIEKLDTHILYLREQMQQLQSTLETTLYQRFALEQQAVQLETAAKGKMMLHLVKPNYGEATLETNNILATHS